MKVCVAGLWHLGTVTAACLAAGGHDVRGLDFASSIVEGLNHGEPPLFEPGLGDLVSVSLKAGNLSFTTDIKAALSRAEIVWVTYDTPVDDDDVADVGFVVTQVQEMLSYVEDETLVLISSQVPVGTTRLLEQHAAKTYPGKRLSFAYSPENLRLGLAVEAFTKPDRVVVGLRATDKDLSLRNKSRLSSLLKPFTTNIEWMSVESAEITKHALNAFLATSVAFINEIACLCERVGADAMEVSRGLKSEKRIGPGAYLNPGAAFAGGTLARDVTFLEQLGAEHQMPLQLMSAVNASNLNHRSWVRRTLTNLVGDLRNQTLAVWGLAYKPNTSTLRRSDSVELCKWLISQGASVQAYDPIIDVLPDDLANSFSLFETPVAAAANAAAVIIATGSPEYKRINSDMLVSVMRNPAVIDPNRFLEDALAGDSRIHYLTVGRTPRLSKQQQ